MIMTLAMHVGLLGRNKHGINYSLGSLLYRLFTFSLLDL
jgi:hypothetical protein